MSPNFPLFAGIIAAMLHVISGPDHLAAVTPFAIESKKKAWKVGLFWGVGHLVGMLFIGVLFLLFKELIPNLVCPSMFDLGENKRVVIISTTEGEDKPIKYPDMFHSADICIINKIDLLPYVNISIEKLKAPALQVNPNLQFFEVSATQGNGMEAWYKWLKKHFVKK